MVCHAGPFLVTACRKNLFVQYNCVTLAAKTMVWNCWKPDCSNITWHDHCWHGLRTLIFFCRFAIWPFFPGNLKFNQFESKFRISINFFMCDICHYFLAFLGCTCLVFQGRNCNGWWMSWPIKAVGMRPTRTRSGCVARPDAWSSTCISGDHCCRPPWNLGAAWWKFWTPIRYLAEGAEMRSMLGRWCYLDVFWVL